MRGTPTHPVGSKQWPAYLLNELVALFKLEQPVLHSRRGTLVHLAPLLKVALWNLSHSKTQRPKPWKRAQPPAPNPGKILFRCLQFSFVCWHPIQWWQGLSVKYICVPLALKAAILLLIPSAFCASSMPRLTFLKPFFKLLLCFQSCNYFPRWNPNSAQKQWHSDALSAASKHTPCHVLPTQHSLCTDCSLVLHSSSSSTSGWPCISCKSHLRKSLLWSSLSSPRNSWAEMHKHKRCNAWLMFFALFLMGLLYLIRAPGRQDPAFFIRTPLPCTVADSKQWLHRFSLQKGERAQ